MNTSDWKKAVRLKQIMEEDADEARRIGYRITTAIQEWLNDRAGRGRASETLRVYTTTGEAFLGFCEDRGIRYVHEVTGDVANRFVDQLIADKRKPRTVNNRARHMNAAFNFMLRRGIAEKNPFQQVERMEEPKDIADPMPEEDIEKVIAAAGKIVGWETERSRGLTRHPDTLTALLMLLRDTGMRRSDALSFSPSLLVKGGKRWVYETTQVKTERKGHKLIAFLDNALVERINSCHWLSKRRPFLAENDSVKSAGDSLYQIFQRLGVLAGVTDCRPHRIRDAFAVRMLQLGVPIYEVSKLLGHSSVTMTEKWYAKWTPGRLRALEDTLNAALDR